MDFLQILQRLKATKRTGWVREGVEGPESIADHMYRMSIMAMIAADGDPAIDQNKCIKYVHPLLSPPKKHTHFILRRERSELTTDISSLGLTCWHLN